MKPFPREYWDAENEKLKNGWDIGYVSTPLRDYFDQLTNKDLRILVPGAGAAWEAEHLHKSGFHQVFMLDFSPVIVDKFLSRYPDFPTGQVFCEDFFNHQGSYDLIVEQTFFSSLLPEQRAAYVNKVNELLADQGKLVGLFFNHEFNFNGPPFGGTPETYRALFEGKFEMEHFATSYNSIKPRRERELFMLLKKC